MTSLPLTVPFGGNAEVSCNPKTDGVTEPAAYGMAEADVQLTLWFDNNEKGETLLLGKTLEEHADKVYAKWQNEDSVYAIPIGLKNLLRIDLRSLRDDRLLRWHHVL